MACNSRADPNLTQDLTPTSFLWLFRIFAEQDYLPDGFSGRVNRGHDTHKLYVTQIDILYNPLRKLV
jgi:hypothetical protein